VLRWGGRRAASLFTQKGQNAVPTDRMKDCRFGQGMESRDRAGEGQVTHLTSGIGIASRHQVTSLPQYTPYVASSSVLVVS
jgi:hypothetical protein